MDGKPEVKLKFRDGVLIRSLKRSQLLKSVTIVEERVRHWWLTRTARGMLAFVSGLFFVIGLLPLFSAFEAHVINVTAKIEPPLCDTRSIGYWANNEGCSHGAGSSDWDNEVQALSAEYSGVFATLSSGDMCAAVWMPNCPSGNTVAARRCRAMAHTLAVELNVASGRLHRSAFLAGADDGDSAFNHLHLFESSTVQEALITLETIIADSSSSRLQLRDAAHVAERMYTFYESENPFHPRCVFDPDDLPQCRPFKGDITIINENTASVINSIDSSADTGGNNADGGGGVTTGDATTETVVEHEVNTNVTDIGCGDCVSCETPCAETNTENREGEANMEDAAAASEDSQVQPEQIVPQPEEQPAEETEHNEAVESAPEEPPVEDTKKKKDETAESLPEEPSQEPAAE